MFGVETHTHTHSEVTKSHMTSSVPERGILFGRVKTVFRVKGPYPLSSGLRSSGERAFGVP